LLRETLSKITSPAPCSVDNLKITVLVRILAISGCHRHNEFIKLVDHNAAELVCWRVHKYWVCSQRVHTKGSGNNCCRTLYGKIIRVSKFMTGTCPAREFKIRVTLGSKTVWRFLKNLESTQVRRHWETNQDQAFRQRLRTSLHAEIWQKSD
jgi:hypothetical protein